MENWMQKFENKKEETYEEMIRNELDSLLDLIDHSNIYRVTDMEKAVELYEKLEKSGLEYDKKDMILKKKQLAELRFKIKKEEHMKLHESESWNEFEKEEQEREDDEER